MSLSLLSLINVNDPSPHRVNRGIQQMISLHPGPSGTLQELYKYPSRATARVLAIQFYRILRIIEILRDLIFIKGDSKRTL